MILHGVIRDRFPRTVVQFGHQSVRVYESLINQDCWSGPWIPDKAFEDKTVSWNTAQQECTKYGADLVSYESKSEMEWVYNILNWNQDWTIQ